jgi:hypothetical protein
MAMISGSLLEVACIYLSRVRSLLRTLAIAEYGYMACSIPSREPSKKGTEARGIIVSLVDVFGPIKGPNDSWVGLAPYWLTAPCYNEGGSSLIRIKTTLEPLSTQCSSLLRHTPLFSRPQQGPMTACCAADPAGEGAPGADASADWVKS